MCALTFCAPGVLAQTTFLGPQTCTVRPPTCTARQGRLRVHSITSATAVTGSFGRGARFPRRLVGLYELEKLGINPEKLISPNTRAERGLSIAVGLGVVATIGVPLVSPWVQAEGPVAGLIALALTVWAVDTLALNGVLQRAFSLQVQSRRRVAVHEAGHFLVAHLLGVAVESYELPSARVALSGRPGGVLIADVKDADAYTLAALGMSGIASECITFGDSQGGAEDFAEVGRIAATSGPFGRATEQERKVIARWGLMQAVSLVQAHAEALDKLQSAMAKGLTVEQCIAVIDGAVDGAALREA